MNKPQSPMPVQNATLARMQQYMSPSPVPSISTELLATADGDLNRELNRFLFDPPSNADLLKGKRIAVCCANGVEEVEITGSMRWLTGHGATVHIVSPRIGEFPPTLGLRFPPLAGTHVLAVRLMENAGWLKIDRYLDQAKVADYDAVIVPSGCWNPDFLRADKLAQDVLRDMHAAGNPTCAVCHGQWVMVSARMLKGERATAVWNIQIDRENAGGHRARRALRCRRQSDHRALSLRSAAPHSGVGGATGQIGRRLLTIGFWPYLGSGDVSGLKSVRLG